MNPYQVVKDLESELCSYTGAQYAVTVNSCTMAILLACAFKKYKGFHGEVSIPSHTYPSVPQSIIHAGLKVKFEDIKWSGEYDLWPLNVYDYARRMTSEMYEADTFQCVSFQAAKILGDTQGGAILHDNDKADVWLRKARFDGRSEGVAPKYDDFILGWHCYMSPDVAARLLLKLYSLPKHNDDLPSDDYPDLSLQPLFKCNQ